MTAHSDLNCDCWCHVRSALRSYFYQREANPAPYLNVQIEQLRLADQLTICGIDARASLCAAQEQLAQRLQMYVAVDKALVSNRPKATSAEEPESLKVVCDLCGESLRPQQFHSHMTKHSRDYQSSV